MRWVAFFVPESLERPTGGNLYDRCVMEQWARRGLPFTPVRVGEGGVVAEDVERALSSPIWLEDAWFEPRIRALAARAGTRVRVPLVHVPRGFLEEGGGVPGAGALTAEERRYYERASGLVFVARATAAQALETWSPGTRRPPVHFAHPGRDHPAARPAQGGSEGSEGRLIIGCVGRIDSNKGQARFAERLLEFRERHPGVELRLRVVGPEGEPAEAGRLRAAARESGGWIEWSGPLAAEALPGFYSGLDLLALPSRYEAWPLVAVEALGQGVPVMAWANGGVREVVRPDCGVLFDREPGEAELERELLRLARLSEAERRGLRARARQAHLLLPTWERTAQGLWDFLQRIGETSCA